MREVQVVVVSLARAGDAAGACTDAERARASAFGSRDVARRWLAARGTLRQVLAQRTGEAPRALEFVNGRYGKPALVGGGVEFNLSHSGELAVIAISTAPVGVDVEAPRTLHSPGRFARRILDADALAGWEARGSQHDELLQAWTRTEALAKATGTGMGRRAPVQGWDVRDLAVAAAFGAVASIGSEWEVVATLREPA